MWSGLKKTFTLSLVMDAMCQTRVNLWSGLKDCLPFSVFSTLCTRLSYIVMYHALQTKERSKMNFKIFLLNFRRDTQKKNSVQG